MHVTLVQHGDFPIDQVMIGPERVGYKSQRSNIVTLIKDISDAERKAIIEQLEVKEVRDVKGSN